jgi:hypothetical protein
MRAKFLALNCLGREIVNEKKKLLPRIDEKWNALAHCCSHRTHMALPSQELPRWLQHRPKQNEPSSWRVAVNPRT